jgi:hypothetical protein
MDLKLNDPACQTLYEAFRQKQNACVIREDFVGAGKAKEIALEIRRLARQLIALRSLHETSNITNRMRENINLDDADAVRRIRERKNQKIHKDIMRDREEESILEQLDLIREEAIASSSIVGVVTGLDSFVSTKKKERDQKLKEQYQIENANMKDIEDILNTPAIPVEKYIQCHNELENIMHSWVVNSGEELCYPPELTMGQKREFDFVIVLFGDYFVRCILSRSSMLVKIGLQALDYYVPTLAKELGVATVFKTIVFVLAVVMTSLLESDGGDEVSKANNGNKGIRDSVVHLCKTIFTWIPNVPSSTTSSTSTVIPPPFPNLPKMLFQSIDQQKVGYITMDQFADIIQSSSRVREFLLGQNSLNMLLIPKTEKLLFSGKPALDEKTFTQRINILSPSGSSYPYLVFDTLNPDTVKVAVVALLPTLLETVNQLLTSINIPNGCNHGKDEKTGIIYPIGGVSVLFFSPFYKWLY